MKTSHLLFAFILTASAVHAQNTPVPGGRRTPQQQDQADREQRESDEEALEGVSDDQNTIGRWECSLAGGEYSVRLGSITSLSKHSYVLDGSLLVTEVTIDTSGTALARFYYIEPITKDTTFNALDRIQKRAEQLRQRGQNRSGTKADEMAQKTYPATTHAKTIEFRIMNEVELNALYQSARRAWISGKGRNFRIQ